MNESKTWYAVYTRPRWEKKVAQLLVQQGIEAYCPVTKTERLWGKRRSIVLEPLFRPYVFVHVTEKMKWKVVEVGGILNYVTLQGRPARIREHEIEAIRDFVNRYENVRVEPLRLQPSMQVLVTDGAFCDMVGEVTAVRGSNVQISIESLGVKLVATIPCSRLKVVDRSRAATMVGA